MYRTIRTISIRITSLKWVDFVQLYVASIIEFIYFTIQMEQPFFNLKAFRGKIKWSIDKNMWFECKITLNKSIKKNNQQKLINKG